MKKFRQLKCFQPKKRRKILDVRDLIDEFKRDEQSGPIAVPTLANLWEGNVSDNDQHSRKKPKIMHFSMF
jgi:hypothetical protein